MDRQVVKLWRTDGARYERLDARLQPGGGLELISHEMGADDSAPWGTDDEERTLEIAPEDVGRLALALIAARFGRDRKGFDALADFCASAGVDYVVRTWT